MINFHIADLLARIHIAGSKFIHTVIVIYNLYILRLLFTFYKEGIIEGFRVYNNQILVFLKYNPLNLKFLFKGIKLISTPGRRQYWTLKKLNKVYSYSNFSGFFLINSSAGIITSADALLNYRKGGEIIFKFSI